MRLFASMSSHMYNQHVLRLKWLLLARTVPPATHELLLVGRDVVHVYVLLYVKKYIYDISFLLCFYAVGNQYIHFIKPVNYKQYFYRKWSKLG